MTDRHENREIRHEAHEAERAERREDHEVAREERRAEREDRGDLTENEQVEHDERYSPASEKETEVAQSEPEPAGVMTRPGEGGPDDAGDIEIDEQAILERISEHDHAHHTEPEDRPVG